MSARAHIGRPSATKGGRTHCAVVVVQVEMVRDNKCVDLAAQAQPVALRQAKRARCTCSAGHAVATTPRALLLPTPLACSQTSSRGASTTSGSWTRAQELASRSQRIERILERQYWRVRVRALKLNLRVCLSVCLPVCGCLGQGIWCRSAAGVIVERACEQLYCSWPIGDTESWRAASLRMED